jgi:haloalkane dehalogenase
MKTLRTPDSQFENLPDYPFSPHYTEVDDSEGGTLRIHHVDEGPRDAPIVLCMHGQPSWSYLYRHMIPLLTQAGLRVLAPDLVGYGRSDKPASVEDYSYQRQVDWMTAWLKANDVQNATFFGQDWGGLIGLRIVAENPERFERVVIGNTGLPLPQTTTPEVIEEVRRFRAEAPTPTMPEVMKALGEGGSGPLSFAYWQKWCWESEDLPVGMAVMTACGSKVLTPEEVAAYDAPFPDASFKMGPRAMPTQVPTLSNDPSVEANRKAWEVFKKWDKPFLTAFDDSDPVSAGGEIQFIKVVPGAQGQEHQKLSGGGHFFQEAKSDELAKIVIDLIRST